MSETATRGARDVIVVRDPDDDSVVGEVEATRAPVLAAHERSRILTAVAARVESQAESHAVLIASEGIKTICEARHEQVIDSNGTVVR